MNLTNQSLSVTVNSSVNSSAAPPDAAQDFVDCLSDVLRFNQRQIDVLTDDGYEKADDLAYWPYDDIKAWVTHKEKLKVNQGGCTFGDMKVRGLLGLAW